MNILRSKFRTVLVALLIAPVSGLVAQTVQFYGVAKRANYLQNSSATPVVSALPSDPDGYIYHFDADVKGTSLNLFSSIKLTLPNATQYTLVNKDALDNTSFGFGPSGTVHGFASKSALDAAFANGTYNVTLGSTVVPLTLGVADTYPAEIPTVTGGTWDVNGKFVINATTGATITFNTFSSYASGGYISGDIYTISGSYTGNKVVMQRNINITGYLTDPLATSITVAPSVLLPGQTYYGELNFGRLTAGDSASIPGALGHANFDYITGFMIRTLGSFADFNADGKPDLVWSNTSTGERYLWLMNGSSFSSGVSLGVVPTQWQIAGTGDFNGDGKTDLVWTNTNTGERYLWLMNGTAFSSSVFLGIMPTQWKITGTGDFNGDGKTDLVWTNTSTGERYIWLMNGTSYSSSVFLGIVATQWTITP